MAEPYRPLQDDVIVETLPVQSASSEQRELRRKHLQLRAQPDNLPLAISLAQDYIVTTRQTGDPRYLGYAQSALQLWWEDDLAPPEILLLRATIRQANHDFVSALNDLNTLLRMQPNHLQGRLTRASIRIVQGNYADAANDCRLLRGNTAIRSACLAQVSALTGHAKLAYQQLRQVQTLLASDRRETRLWIELLLAETALQSGQDRVAQQHFDAARQLDPHDPFLLATYSDFLLDQKQYNKVIQLLRSHERIDALLLRLCIAEYALQHPDRQRHGELLNDRYTAAALRGDNLHLRELARFHLVITKNYSKAMQLAQQNWSIQRETADARLILEAAVAANAPESAQSTLQWLNTNRLQHPAINSLAQAFRQKRP